GLAGLLATRALFRLAGAIEIVGSGETTAFVGRYLADTIGPERAAGCRLRAVSPGLVLSGPSWRLDAFPSVPRGSPSLGYLFQDEPRRPLLSGRLAELGVPEGRQRTSLAQGRPVVLTDGSRITPEMVRGPSVAGVKLAIVGDTEEINGLIEP